MTRKVTVTSKKWKAKKDGKGYGWISSKVTRFQCSGLNKNTIGHDIVPSMRGSVILQGENNEVMTTEGMGITDMSESLSMTASQGLTGADDDV